MTLFDRNNRIRLKDWASRIQDCYESNSAFTNLVMELQEVYLVGSELYKGDLLKKVCSQPYATFQFVSKEKAEKAESLDKAIFQIAPSDERYDLQNPLITLGRGSDNDITIVDYAISKNHCHFSRDKSNRLVLTSNSPTNAIKHNGDKIESEKSIALNYKDTILLGRFEFTITNGFELAAQAMAVNASGKMLMDSIYEFVRQQPSDVLQKIAITCKIENAAKLSKGQLINALKRLPAETVMTELSIL